MLAPFSHAILRNHEYAALRIAFPHERKMSSMQPGNPRAVRSCALGVAAS